MSVDDRAREEQIADEYIEWFLDRKLGPMDPEVKAILEAWEDGSDERPWNDAGPENEKTISEEEEPMSLMDCAATQLADMLDGMEHHPHNTGGLSMLDEATGAFGDKNPRLAELQRTFGNARYAHKRSWSTEAQAYSGEAWSAAMSAAHALAAALRELGDMRIARCKRPAGWGTCNLPLDEDGQCRSTLGHTDGGSGNVIPL